MNFNFPDRYSQHAAHCILELFIFLIVCFPLISLAAPAPASAEIIVSIEEMDETGTIVLDNAWEFYWDTFIDPTTDQWPDPDTLIANQYWNKLNINGQSLPPVGIATYRQRIILPQHQDRMAFLIRENNIASQYFVNGDLVGAVGRPHTDPDLEEGNWEPTVLAFSTESDTLDVVVHVSNHKFRNGGLGRPVRFGHVEAVTRHLRRMQNRDLVFIGMYLALALYHLGIFILRREHFLSLGLSAVFLLWAGRMMFATNFLILQFVEHIPWHMQMRLEYLSLYLLIIISVLYFMYRFDANRIRRRSLVLWVLLAIFCSSLFLPNTILISRFAQVFLYLLIPLSIMPLLAIIQAAMKGGKDTWIFVTGAIILVSALINDTLLTLDLIQSIVLVPTAFFIFVFSQAMLVAKEYADAFTDLTIEVNRRKEAEFKLLDHQKHLERSVAERTDELAKSNDLLENEIMEKEKHAVELKASNDAKDKVFSIIAHDLRGPIGSQAAFLSYLNSSVTEIKKEQFAEYLGAMESSLKKIYSMLENLLSWSRSQLGVIKPELEHISLSDVCKNAISSVKQQAEIKEIQIEFAPLENDIIKGDQSMLEVIFRNLLTNAIKFSHRGKSIEIKIEQEVEALVFSVTDHGIGIEKQHQDSLFKLDGKFRQIGTEDEVSSGLGLILVKEFTMQNLGKVWLESTPGEGTTFYLSFPPA